MARMQPELRKQNLIEIAFRQFMQKGYEKTSIRSIVGEAGGEVGMFYHHFSSKEEIFEAALEQYNIEFVSRIKHLATNHKEVPFAELLKLILINVEQALNEYSHMQAGTVNKQILSIMHRNTMLKLAPTFYEIIKDYSCRGEIHPPDIEFCLLSDFLLYGMSAIIHNHQIESIDAKTKAIQILFSRLLGIFIP